MTTDAGIFGLVLLAQAGETKRQCAGCRIESSHVVTLSRIGTDPGFLGDPYSIARDGRGRFIVAVPWGTTREPPFVFDSIGNFASRIGRVGSGPNEYQQPIRILVGRGDSIAIFDQRTARVSILAPDLRYVRSFTGGEYREGAWLAGGDFIVQSDLGASLFLRLSPSGSRIRAWRDSLPDLNGIPGLQRARVWFATADSGFWSARQTQRYELEFRDKSGELRHTIRPRAAWFSPYDSSTNSRPGLVPQARIVGMWQDREGRLWVVGNTADSSWRRATWETTKGERGVTVTRATDINALVDGVIEVLDSRTGVSLAITHLPERIAGVAAPGFIFSVRQDADGFRQAVVRAVRLVGR